MKLKKSYCLIAFFASAFQAFGMYHIHSAADITEGGVLGATLLLQHWLQISPAISSFVLNAFCYLLGWKTHGKTFLAYSAIAACGYSLGYWLWEQFPPLWPEIIHYPLAAALIGALFIGAILVAFHYLSGRAPATKPYILVLHAENDAAEDNAQKAIAASVKRQALKSKTVTEAGVELTVEVRLAGAESAFVNDLRKIPGVADVTLVSYNGDYMA